MDNLIVAVEGQYRTVVGDDFPQAVIVADVCMHVFYQVIVTTLIPTWPEVHSHVYCMVFLEFCKHQVATL